MEMKTIFLKVIFLQKKFNFLGYFWISIPIKKKLTKFFKIFYFFGRKIQILFNFGKKIKKNKIFFNDLGERKKNLCILVFSYSQFFSNLFFDFEKNKKFIKIFTTFF